MGSALAPNVKDRIWICWKRGTKRTKRFQGKTWWYARRAAAVHFGVCEQSIEYKMVEKRE